MNYNYKAYRNIIYKKYRIDINKFSQSIKGGKSDNFNISDIVNYDIS
jgi:hypothetical protein